MADQVGTGFSPAVSGLETRKRMVVEDECCNTAVGAGGSAFWFFIIFIIIVAVLVFILWAFCGDFIGCNDDGDSCGKKKGCGDNKIAQLLGWAVLAALFLIFIFWLLSFLGSSRCYSKC